MTGFLWTVPYPRSTAEPVDRELRTRIESTYSPVPRDEQERFLESVDSIMQLARDRRCLLNDVLDQTAKAIFRTLGFGEVTIGLKSREDGKFRYNVFFGVRKEVEQNLRKLAYTDQDMTDEAKFPHVDTGKISMMFPAESLPDDQHPYFNRPFSLKGKRENIEEFKEGDYIDVYMYGSGREIIGWVEVAAPRSGKMPSRTTIRWLELITNVASLAVMQKWAEENQQKR